MTKEPVGPDEWLKDYSGQDKMTLVEQDPDKIVIRWGGKDGYDEYHLNKETGTMKLVDSRGEQGVCQYCGASEEQPMHARGCPFHVIQSLKEDRKDSLFAPAGNRLTDAVRKFFSDAHRLMLLKNADYAGDGDPFSNFRRVVPVLGISLAESVFVRMSDKWARLENLMEHQTNAVEGETIRDTLIDLANYAGIMLAALEES